MELTAIPYGPSLSIVTISPVTVVTASGSPDITLTTGTENKISGGDYATSITPRESTQVASALGPRGLTGPAGTQGILTQTECGPIANGDMEIVDSADITAIYTLKWHLTILDTLAGMCQHVEVVGVKASTGLQYSVYGQTGDRIYHGVGLNMSGTNLELSIINHHLNPILVFALRLNYRKT